MHYVVVGSGVSGLSAAYTLCKHGGRECKVTLLESAKTLGGHAKTILTPDGEEIDIGYMVMNDLTYPNLNRLFSEINADVEPSDMSFSVFDDKNKKFSWSFQGGYSWLLRNCWKVRLWKFVKSHGEFAKRAINFLHNPVPLNLGMRDFARDLDPLFVEKWLIPFVSAVWSTSSDHALDFAALPLLKFMHHHMFLTLDTVKWTTPKGRSHSYVDRLIEACSSQLHVRTNAQVVKLDSEQQYVTLQNDEKIHYDSLILACSAVQQAKLNPPAKKWLENFQVNPCRVVLHTSPDGMPYLKEDWSSWNVAQTENVSGESVTIEQQQQQSNRNNNNITSVNGPRVTYWISKLQNLKNPNIFLTLNPLKEPRGIFYETIDMQHPVMDGDAFRAQLDESKYQGVNNIFYAGAWLRNGFHEDGCFTGMLAARRALKRIDIPIEFPSLPGLPPTPVRGVSTHTRKTKGSSYLVNYDMNLFRFNTATPPPAPAYERTDHFGDPTMPLDTCVRNELAKQIGYWPLGKIEAVCNLRYANCCFNPITPYFAYDENNMLKALLLEVHNTPWGERCLYAMHVRENNVLEPAIQAKKMHVSPFNAPPPSSSTSSNSNSSGDVVVSPVTEGTNYKFTLNNKDDISLDVIRADSNEVIMTASWKLLPGPPPVVIKTGSWRTMLIIYWQAAMLFSSMSMFSYSFPKLPWSNPLLLSQLGFVIVCVAHLFSSATATSSGYGYMYALAFGALAVANAAHHRARGVNLMVVPLVIMTTLLCFWLNAIHTVGNHTHMLELIVCACSSFLLFFLSSTAATQKYEELRTVSYVNMALGSLSCVYPLPYWCYAALAWFTFRVMMQNLKFTGLAGLISLMIHLPLMWLLVIAHTTTTATTTFLANQAPTISNYLLATANAIGYTHVVYDLVFVSNWYRGLIQFPYVLICAIFSPIWSQTVKESMWGRWNMLCYDWFTLISLFCVHVMLCSLWTAATNSYAMMKWRDEVIVGIMNKTLMYLTNGKVGLRILDERKRREEKRQKQNDDENNSYKSNSNNNVAIIVVRKPLEFLEALLNFGELGLGESFVRGEWEEHNTGEIFDILCGLSVLNNSKIHLLRYLNPAFYFRRTGFALQFGALDRMQSANSIASHYDDGNELFRTFLGEDMVYTSATWEGVDTSMSLEEAQRTKVTRILDLARDKHNPTAHLRLMDIGSGWGYLVNAAKERGHNAMGLCNCESMFKLATEKYGPSFVKMDYRDIPTTHTFDAITCVEMIEAVPARDYKEFVASCSRALRPGGKVVMQVINAYAFNNEVASKFEPDPLGSFVTTHIFPGQQIPNLEFLHRAFLNSGEFTRVFTETASHDYARTLYHWRDRLEQAAIRFHPDVVRKYRYYLAFCQAGFHTEMLHVSRVVFEKRKL